MLLESGVSLDQCFRTLAGPEGSAAPCVRQTMKLLVDDLQHAIPYPAALQRWAASLGVDGARELSGLFRQRLIQGRSEEHTYELPSLMRISYAVFCLKK